MKRCRIVLTSGGSIMVKGDFESVTARLRGNRGGLIEMAKANRRGHTAEFETSPVLVNVEMVTCVFEEVS